MRKLTLKSNQIVALGLASIATLSLATGCSRSGNTPVAEGIKNQVLHIGNGTEPSELDPNIVTGVPESNILAALLEGLVAEDPKDLHPVPGAAESWTISPDGKTYTFKMRKGAKWSNGEPVTAHDFEYSWKRILNPKLGAEYAYMLHYVKGAKAFNEGKTTDWNTVGAKAKDDYTFVVTLENPTPFFLAILTHQSTFPVNKGAVEKFGHYDDKTQIKWTRAGNFVGNGPFMLKAWEPNKIIIVEKNPNYWDAATLKLNAIHFHPIESEQTEENAFRTGQLHITNTVPSPLIPEYKKNKPNLLHINPYLGTYYYRINVTKVKDKRVRQALNMALDRKSIVDFVTKGGQIPALNFTPAGTGGFTPQPKIEENVEKARKLLAEAGYPEGKGLGPIEILFNTSEGHKSIAEAIQQMWKKNLGIEVTLTNQDWKVYLNSQKTLAYHVSRAGWIGDYNDPNTFLDMFVTNGGNNQTGFSSKEYDSLVEKAAKAKSQAERFKYFQRIEEILIDEAPVIPIYTYTRVKLMDPSVKGFYPNVLDHHPLKFIYLESADKAVAKN